LRVSRDGPEMICCTRDGLFTRDVLLHQRWSVAPKMVCCTRDGLLHIEMALEMVCSNTSSIAPIKLLQISNRDALIAPINRCTYLAYEEIDYCLYCGDKRTLQHTATHWKRCSIACIERRSDASCSMHTCMHTCLST